MSTSEHTISPDSGIYRFLCVVNGKCYVGSSARMASRKAEHLRDLRNGKHASRRFQNAWNKYGAEAFRYEVLEEVLAADLFSREQHWIDHFRSADKNHGFNILPAAGSPLGVKRSEETKAKMRVSRRNRVEKPFSDEHKANLSKALIGNQRTKGHKLTDEHKAKLSAVSKGRPRPYVSQALKGRPKSPEHTARVIAAKMAKKRRVGPGERQSLLFDS